MQKITQQMQQFQKNKIVPDNSAIEAMQSQCLS